MTRSGSWSGAWPYGDIIVWAHLIKGGSTSDGIVRIYRCWDSDMRISRMGSSESVPMVS